MTNHLASACEQNWETFCEVDRACPDKMSEFSFEGGGIGLNTLLMSSSASGSSPRAVLALFSNCRFWAHLKQKTAIVILFVDAKPTILSLEPKANYRYDLNKEMKTNIHG